MMMTKEIVACINNTGGRFLKYNKTKTTETENGNVGMWEEISNVAARDKVSHALRTKVASWKRQQQQQQQQFLEMNNDTIAKGSGGEGRRQSASSSIMTSNTRC